MKILESPSVVDDLFEQMDDIDSEILTAAADWKFSLLRVAPTFDQVLETPEEVLSLVSHYSKRGFVVSYDGEDGKILIEWHHPSFTWYEAQQITRASPEMIPRLGTGFRAPLLYMCLTNKNDIRGENDFTLQRELNKLVKSRAVLGHTTATFGFAGVPRQSQEELFKATFEYLESKSFTVVWDPGLERFIVQWGQTFSGLAFHGSETDSELE